MKTFLKGLWIGGTMTIPGISGGTMAAIIGIYEDLINAFVDWRKAPKKNITFLMIFSLGGGLGFITFARIVTKLLNMPTAGMIFRILCCIFVLGSIPLLVKESGLKKVRPGNVAAVIAGAMSVYGLSCLPTGLFNSGSGIRLIILQLIGGILVAIALILPGINVSHMLYILGLYEIILDWVYEFNIISLLPFTIGVLAGCIFTTHLIKYLLDNYKETVYMVLIGFVAVSVITLLA